MIWVLAIIVLVVGWYWLEGRRDRRLFAKKPGRLCENLRPQAAAELLHSRTDVQVLDVRSPSEFAGGSLPGAINISIGDPHFRQRVGDLDKTKPVLVYCAGGYRSREAVEHLLALDFQSIHHLHRGFLSWRMAGLETEDLRTGRSD